MLINDSSFIISERWSKQWNFIEASELSLDVLIYFLDTRHFKAGAFFSRCTVLYFMIRKMNEENYV